MRTLVRRAGTVAAAALIAAAVTACGSTDQNAQSEQGNASSAGTAVIPVVTSSNVWGDVVAQVGGDLVQVTSLVDDPSADPHSFEPNAQAQLAVSKAALLVENGGGYDSYLDTMAQASAASVPLLNAVEISGLTDATAVSTAAGSEPAEFNEHVWYDFPTVEKVATRIADELTSIRPDQTPTFRANLASFLTAVDGLTTRLDAIKAAHAGDPVAITEPVPLYLTEAAGLVNLTPAEFSEAIEEGTDVPPTVLVDTLALLQDRKVVALVYNEQTSSPETEQVLAAAKDAAIPVVGVTETLPEGKDYLSWMDANVTALAAAVGG